MKEYRHINRSTGEIVDKWDKLKKGGNIMFLEDQEINNGCKVLLSYMLSSGRHGVWQGSQKYLGDKLGIHTVNVSKYIKLLTDKGYIISVDLMGKRAYKINPTIGE